MSRLVVLAEVHAERDRQIDIGYDSLHDDSVGPKLLIEWACDRLHDGNRGTDQELREAAIESAAMLCALIELLDRWAE